MNYKSITILGAMALGTAAMAQVGVDGAYGAEWTGSTPSSVLHDAAAPTSNFQNPGPTTAGASYDIYFRSDATYVYGLVNITGDAASSAGLFANLYFDLDPQRNNGSDWGMEINGNTQTATAFVAGGPSGYNLGNNVLVASTATGIEFALKWSYVMNGGNPDISYYSGINEGGPVLPGGRLQLRLSQSFGYSVAGGATYGEDRFGEAIAPVPEPASMAALGLGVLGLLRRRRATTK